ncbi:putative membrane protein [Wolbachia pipientis wVitA]|nr:putative membrane protein [Wolbachia pipientis wVitA]
MFQGKKVLFINNIIVINISNIINLIGKERNIVQLIFIFILLINLVKYKKIIIIPPIMIKNKM